MSAVWLINFPTRHGQEQDDTESLFEVVRLCDSSILGARESVLLAWLKQLNNTRTLFSLERQEKSSEEERTLTQKMAGVSCKYALNLFNFEKIPKSHKQKKPLYQIPHTSSCPVSAPWQFEYKKTRLG